MQYNTARPSLLIAEYGRNIQSLIAHACTIQDREQRTKIAKEIVNAMASLNPASKDMQDYKHKLWDHLIIMSDFKLDVDSPYPSPQREKIEEKPQKVSYPSNNIKFKFYGKTMENMIKHIATMEAPENKQEVTRNLANFMKMSYLAWNKDTVDDVTILNHLNELSAGKLSLSEEDKLNHSNNLLAMTKQFKDNKRPQHNHKNRNRKNRNKKPR
ncbi:MAG: hypothetical protein RIQ89_1481 [Bacteroidota bacterium]|jgi:hypothetical protein